MPLISLRMDLVYDQNLFCFGTVSCPGSLTSIMLSTNCQYDCPSAFWSFALVSLYCCMSWARQIINITIDWNFVTEMEILSFSINIFLYIGPNAIFGGLINTRNQPLHHKTVSFETPWTLLITRSTVTVGRILLFTFIGSECAHVCKLNYARFFHTNVIPRTDSHF